MHDIHRNACLTYLFIPSNIPVAGADRHKDISKHKPRPAKSWVVRLISKRQQCRAEAKYPILVIIPPVAPPLNETPDTHAVSGSLNIASLEAHTLLVSHSIFLWRRFVLIGQSTKFWQLVCSGAILSCPDLSLVVDLSSGDDWPTAHSQHSALVQCSWLCALWWVSCSDKYNHDHPVAPLLQPFGTWRSPHNNSALTGQLSQGWRGSLVLRVSFCGLKELLAGLKRLSSKDRRWWGGWEVGC